MKEIALYIHIPFCQSKCYYCDFSSYADKEYLVDKYIKYLKKELDMYIEKLNDYSIKTIFIGGGTPSIINPEYIKDVLDYINNKFNTNFLSEITIEANPKTITEDKLKVYRAIGINRISLGLQSMDNKLLKKIGRIHTKEDFIKTYSLIRKYGYNNINVDIMFNLPDQTIDDVLKTLEEVVELGVEHISFYSMKLEENTPFYHQYEKGKLNLPNEEDERDMYHKAIDFLEKNGYKHYEISNFSKEDYQCTHNLFYWQLRPYVGVGLSAHSNIFDKRYGNHIDFEKYFNSIDNNQFPICEQEYISTDVKRSEYMILGLRLINGVNKEEFKKIFNKDLEEIWSKEIEKLENQKLIKVNNKNIKLTRKGLDLSNRVFVEFM